MNMKIYVCLIITFLFASLFAGTTGRIAGRVTDLDGKPLAYASLILAGEERGVQSDENGRFLMRFIDPGKHELVCSKMGFESEKIIGLLVSIDETTVQNFRLESSVLEVPGITVSEAKNKLVDKLQTSSGAVINQQFIEDVDVADMENLIALQAGASVNNGELHIRGGRMNEVVYIIDGISVTDIMDGESALAIDTDAISEMKVMTGGFAAEYGNAQSGVVNIITKKGSRDYHGKVEFSSDLITNISNNEIAKIMLSGPVVPIGKLRDKLTFFFNTKIDRSDTYLRKNYGIEAYDEIYYYAIPVLGNFWRNYDYYHPYDKRDEFLGVETEERNSNNLNYNLKLFYELSPLDKFSFAVRQDIVHYFPYDHEWRYAMEHYEEIKTTQTQFMGTYSKNINSKLNLDLKLGYYRKLYEEAPRDFDLNCLFAKDPDSFNLYDENYPGMCDGINYYGEDGNIDDTVDLWNFNIFNVTHDLNDYFKAPGTYHNYFITNTNDVYTAKVDLDYRHNEVHNFKTGLEVIKHDLKRDKLINPWNVNSYLYNDYLEDCTPEDSVWVFFFQKYKMLYGLDDIYDATLYAAGDKLGVQAEPWQYSWYLQDMMEWDGLVVNAGLRVDSWDLGADYLQLDDHNIYQKVKIPSKDRFHLMVSPRIGVSHVISEKNVLHFAFNYQNQLPQLQAVYPDATTFDIWMGSLSWGAVVMGNPALEPQMTIAGEIGLQREMSENLYLDATVYYKKNYNYLGMEKYYLSPGEDELYYYRYVTRDYGTNQGLDINLQRPLMKFISASVAYSLSWAEGTDSDMFELADGQEELIQNNTLREFPLDWDSRHNVAGNVTFRIADKEDFYIPTTNLRLPFDDFSVNFNYTFATGTPYTDVSMDEVNGARLPNSEMANLKVSKGFNLLGDSKLKLSIKWKNLFNNENINFAYINTGSPYYDGQGFDDPLNQALNELQTNNPQNVNSFREIYFNVAISW